MLLIISSGLSAPVEQIQQALFILRIDPVTGTALFSIQIHVFPVNADHTGRIPGTLHPSFNL